MFEKIFRAAETLLSSFLPFYWLRHAAIALVISLAMWFVPHAWAWAGAMFYLGREIRDREKLGVWDWPGLLWPVGACCALWVIFTIAGG